MRESDIQTQILHYLDLKGVFHWRQNTGAMVANHTDKNGVESKRYVKFGKPGISDILGCYNGKMFAIEVKANKNKATEAQKNFLAELVKAGGVGMICYSLEEFISDWKKAFN